MTMTTARPATRSSIRRRRFDQPVLQAIPFVTTIVVLLPVAFLAIAALSDGPFQGLETQFTFAKVIVAYTDPTLLAALRNSLLLGVIVAGISTALAIPIAWLVVRTDMPWRGGFTRVMTLAFYMSPLFLAIAWAALGAPRGGVISQISQTVTGSREGPVNIYSFGGIVFVSVLHYIPVSFLLITAALTAAAGALEDASHMSRAGHLQTFRSITLPLITPTIVSSLLQVGVFAAEQFAVPYFFGLQSNFHTLPTQLYSDLSLSRPDYNRAAAGGTMLLWFTGAGIYLFRRYSRLGDRYASLAGKASSARLVPLRGWRWPAASLILLYLFLAVGAPILALLWGSFQRFPSPVLTTETLSTFHWTNMLTQPVMLTAIKNSLLLASLAALVTVLFCFVVSFVITRTTTRGRALIDYATSAPLALPSIVLGLGILAFYLALPLPLYGTLVGLGLAYAIRYMGYGVRALNAGLQQVHSELTEAAYMSRATGPQVIRDIQLPILRPTLANVWIVMFVAFIQEVNLTVLLYTQNTITIPIVIFTQLHSALLNSVYPMTLLLLVATFICVEIVRSIPGYGSEIGYATKPQGRFMNLISAALKPFKRRRTVPEPGVTVSG